MNTPEQSAAIEELSTYGLNVESMTESQFNLAAKNASDNFYNHVRHMNELEEELRRMKKELKDLNRVDDLFSALNDWWN